MKTNMDRLKRAVAGRRKLRDLAAAAAADADERLRRLDELRERHRREQLSTVQRLRDDLRRAERASDLVLAAREVEILHRAARGVLADRAIAQRGSDAAHGRLRTRENELRTTEKRVEQVLAERERARNRSEQAEQDDLSATRATGDRSRGGAR